jgi:hypothetical protein
MKIHLSALIQEESSFPHGQEDEHSTPIHPRLLISEHDRNVFRRDGLAV